MFITINCDRRSPQRGRNDPIGRIVVTGVTRDDTVPHGASRDTIAIQAVCCDFIAGKDHIEIRVVAVIPVIITVSDIIAVSLLAHDRDKAFQIVILSS